MKKIVALVCLIFAFLLGACSTVGVNAEQPWPIQIWKHNENGKYETLCVVDEDTGVNYIVVSGAQGKAITVFNNLGQIVRTTRGLGFEQKVYTGAKGVYIVKVGNKTYNISL